MIERALADKSMPLTFIEKNTSLTEVRVATFTIGTLNRVAMSSNAEKPAPYRWYLAVSAAPAGFQRDGHAYSLEDAKAAIEAAWEAWIEAAGLSERS